MLVAAWLAAPADVSAQTQDLSAAPSAEAAAPSEPGLDPPPTKALPQVSAAPSAYPADADTEDALAMAELAKLGLSEGSEGGSQRPLHFSGFADFNFVSLLAPKDSPWRGPYERYAPFYVGNFNLYLNKNLTDDLRMFGEVRFTFLPNGSTDATTGNATGEFVSTAAQDYADSWRPLKWGAIEIERVYIEWTAHRALVIRAGVFLTPYGIWNVDHGSTTVVTPQRPFIIGQELFPERQTGIEVLGQFDVSAHNTFGYHATISNGLGPISEYRDLDGNKAVGGRAYWSYDGFGELRVGASAFYGTDTAALEVPGLASDGQHLKYNQRITSKSAVLSLAADAQWKFGGLLLQTEVITQQRRYDEQGRVGITSPLLGQYIAPLDRFSWGVYGLVGYRFEWLGIMPYAILQSVDTNDPVNFVLFELYAWHLGLNIRPIDVLVIKLDFQEVNFPNGSFVSEEPLRVGQFQIAWAF
jgi:hypothetical protein